MQRSTPPAPEPSSRVLSLPEGWFVRRTTDHWVVLGPTGLFLVGRVSGDPIPEAARTAVLANHLRNRLAESVDAVPFVDPVVVTSDPLTGHLCAMVEPELLESFLTTGPEVIAEGRLQVLRHSLPAVVTAMEVDGVFG